MQPTTELCSSETGLVYRLRRGPPHGPVLIMLHGLSGDENVMWIFDHTLPREATVIAPRALYASELGGYSWARSVVRGDLDQVDFAEALDRLPGLVSEIVAVYQADPRRVIALGFSQGAALSYAWSLAQPAALHGVIALAGFLPLHNNAATESKQALPPYLIIHGTRDADVPIERARVARSILESRGAAVEYHEYPVGHKVSAQGAKEIARWIRNRVSA